MATALEQKLSLRGTPIYVTPGVPQTPDAQNPTVVFVHNMWGNHRLLARHVQLFNSLGYTTVTFNLYQASSIKDPHPFGWWGRWGFMHQRWVEQISDVLNSIEGQKIVFAMSGPSISAIIAASGRTDITHLVCDSGPFKEVWSCTYRLFTQIWHVPTALLRTIATTGAVIIWGPHAFFRSQRALKNWNKSAPILSIRGEKDPLVFPSNIDGIFKDHKDLNITIWSLPEAHHLDALKMFPDLYREKIEFFLK
ncbi:alpha/beta hydrolase [bacterium]|nr:alpha/beta hydrolase [bacterium]